MQTIIIDGTNATLGRLASYAAKQALLGNKIIILNSEKAVISGRKKSTIRSYKDKRSRGGSSQRGPFYPREPEKILKRAIRGMLPDYRRGKGREAFKRITCYSGVPEEHKDKKMIKAGKEKTSVYMSIKEVSNKM